jgi:competence protein ComEC
MQQKEIFEYYSSFQNQEVTFRGLIDEEPSIQGTSQNFNVTVFSPDQEKQKKSMRVHITEKIYPTYAYGMEIELKGHLVSPRNFSGFDYVNYLKKDDIYFLMKNPSIRVLEKNKGNILVHKLLSIKEKFIENINAVLGEPHAALAGGLVVGEKNSLGKDLLDDFRRAGLIHIVVLSGYNITIVADSIRKLLTLFLPRTYSLLVGASSIVLFGILVGGGATVVRSCIMALIATTAEFFYKDYDVLRALCIAGYGMIFINPIIVLYDPSFQLSFLATLGLILLSSPIEKRLAIWPRLFPEWFGMRGLVASTLATQIIVLPLLLYMMGQISVVGIFVNILVLPFVPLTMLAVFLTGAFGIVSHIFSFIPGVLAHILLSYELTMVHLFAHLPYAVLEFHGFTLWMMWVCYALYIAVFIFFRSRSRNLIRLPPS